MAWNFDELRAKFRRDENRAIIAYLEQYHPSAHSDLGSELFTASADIPERQWYSPSIKQYAYVVLHTPSAIIYALAAGMRQLTFRLPSAELANALADGGKVNALIGDEWIAFDPFRVDRKMAQNRAALKHWCEVAHQYALSLDA
jgi:hypothetical protein